MKSERLTLLITPEFKAFLGEQARSAGVSVSELVRSRCEQKVDDESALLASMTQELRRSVTEARISLQEGLTETASVVAELRARRAERNGTAAATQAAAAAEQVPLPRRRPARQVAAAR